jgi:hypothetical protein
MFVCASGSIAQQQTPVVRPQEPAVQAWRERMAKRPKPAGCFTAAYPAEEWKSIPCSVLPDYPHPRPIFPNPPSRIPPQKKGIPGSKIVGSGNGFFAIANGGLISAAEGFFDQTSGIQSVDSITIAKGKTSHAPGAYSLQMNVEPFQTSACAGANPLPNPGRTGCRGWIQYIFANGATASTVLIEAWLKNFGDTCPGHGTVSQLPNMPPGVAWKSTVPPGDCYFNLGVNLSAQPVTSLGQLLLRGEAVGGQDSVTITTAEGVLFGTVMSDNLLTLSSVWNEVEFNIFGLADGARATFNLGAAAVVHINIENGSNDTPGLGTGSFTGETSTFDLVPPGCWNAGNPPSLPNIAFAEVTLGVQAAPGCPPMIVPPAPLTCEQVTQDLEAAKQALSEQQAKSKTAYCSGSFSVDCARELEADGDAVTYFTTLKAKTCGH